MSVLYIMMGTQIKLKNKNYLQIYIFLKDMSKENTYLK